MTSTDTGQIVVANRNSGNLSVIDAETDQLLFNVPLPQAEGENFPEPMYAIYLSETDKIVVGDRANDRLVSFNRSDYSINALVPLGEGVFHCWADPDEEQLWVTNDIDNTISVVDPSVSQVINTIPLAEDLVAAGGKLHDVFLDPVTNFAYVSVIGIPGDRDVVVKYSTETFAEVDRAFVGDDPHLSATATNNVLYVPTQEGNEVSVLDRDTLDLVKKIEIPGAHGAVMEIDRESYDVFYTTNLPGEGTDALYAIDTETHQILGNPVDAPFSVPHNIALSAERNKLYVTHSGADNNQVSVYSLDERGIPMLTGSVEVGFNPFGMVAVSPSTTLEEQFDPREPIIDLRNQRKNQTVEFTVRRNAGFSNTIGFYVVEEDGSVVDSFTGEMISPKEEGYLQAVINNRLDISLTAENKEQAIFTTELPGGKIIAPLIAIDSNFDSRSNNNPIVYLAFEASNSDGFEHIRTLGDNKLGFEDLPNGGDLDFNDMIVEYNFV